MVNFSRMLRHLLTPDLRVGRCFPQRTLQAVEASIDAAEQGHAGEIRFVVESALSPSQLLRGETARDRAVEVFSALRVWDTEQNSGVLVYVLLADRDVEIVADRGLNDCVSAAEWEVICKGMEQAFGAGEFEAGALAAITATGKLLRDRLPSQGAGRDELPDRPMLL